MTPAVEHAHVPVVPFSDAPWFAEPCRPHGSTEGVDTSAMARVIVHYNTSVVGLRALAAGVDEARSSGRTLFVVHVVDTILAGRARVTYPSAVEAESSGRSVFLERSFDAIFLALAGNRFDDVDVRVAVVTGPVSLRLAQLADDPRDTVFVAASRSPRFWSRVPRVERIERHWRRYRRTGTLNLITYT